LYKTDVNLQAMICMMCNGVGVLLCQDGTEVDCEQCMRSGIIWLRVAKPAHDDD
jgi:hypothetical protein